MSTQFEEVNVATYANAKGPDAPGKVNNPSEVRWMFNPAAKINVRDRVVGNEINDQGQPVARSFIKPATLVPFRDVTVKVPRPKDQPPLPGSKPEDQVLMPTTKFAWEVADEMQDAYADTGAMIIESLTGVEDEALVRTIFRFCLGTQIKVATDPMLPGEKIPVIPAMLDYLGREALQNIENAFADKTGPEDIAFRGRVEETRRLLAASCNAALSGWARFNTELSRQSVADRSGGHPGKAQFDVRDRRAFAALGETIPTDIQSTKNVTLEKAVELLLNKELQPQVEDPRIAQLEAALAETRDMVEKLANKEAAAA